MDPPTSLCSGVPCSLKILPTAFQLNFQWYVSVCTSARVPLGLATPMPTVSVAGALLSLASPNDDIPWSWPTWRSHTGLPFAPFSQAALDDPPPGWTVTTVSAVRSFAGHFWALPDTTEQMMFLKRRTDNTSQGRNAWTGFIASGWNKKWRIHEQISKILVEYKVHPYIVMRRLGVNTVN